MFFVVKILSNYCYISYRKEIAHACFKVYIYIYFFNRCPNLRAVCIEYTICLIQVCYARVLDYRRKFIEAAQRYNELSYRSLVAETERLEALKKALICTILASAGEWQR